MTREKGLSQQLHQNKDEHSTNQLLKKYLLCAYLGRLRINGLSPDSQFSLSDYLFDNERIVFDFSHLSKQVKDEFIDWFLVAHQKEANYTFYSSAATSDYQGFTAEVALNWWQRIVNLLFYRQKNYQWSLSSLKLAQDYQLNQLEIAVGENGLLVGLKQEAVKNSENKYHQSNQNPQLALRNTKRIYFTDALVKKIINANLHAYNYSLLLSNPHPFSINVPSQQQRIQAMFEYRQIQGFMPVLSWYTNLWLWLQSYFKLPKSQLENKPAQLQLENNTENNTVNKNIDSTLKLLKKKNNVYVYQRSDNDELVVIEKRPDLDTFVFCGGGIKIFAHLGAYKAFEDAQIKPKKFIGSSAGAIMAVLCYLGYSSNEISELFKCFRQEHLIFYDIDFAGLSDTSALKTAIDFMVLKKVNQIIERYQLDQSIEGQQFIMTQVFKEGKLTFDSLRNLKNACPDCELGEDLIVTATNIKQRQTRYFSHNLTPNLEVSTAVAMSSSFPILFKPIFYEGEIYNDGGILNNLPTEVFIDDYSTFLEQIHNNCLSLLAFQFNNGCERGILDTFLTRVYRENFILNWIYELVTGVKDPVSAWEKERIKLRNYGNQVVLIEAAEVSSTQFNLDEKAQAILFDKGYQAGKNYINARYYQDNPDSQAENDEYLYSTFTNAKEAMYYCCYRGRKDWFEYFAQLEQVNESTLNDLRERYFSESDNDISQDDKDERLDNNIAVDPQDLTPNRKLFLTLYPIFLKLPCQLINNAFDLKLYKYARHNFSIIEPLACLNYLEKLQGKTHLLITLFIRMLNAFKAEIIDIETLCKKLAVFESLLELKEDLHNPIFYSAWHTLEEPIQTIINDFEQIQWSSLVDFCQSINQHEKLTVLSSIPSANDENHEKILIELSEAKESKANAMQNA